MMTFRFWKMTTIVDTPAGAGNAAFNLVDRISGVMSDSLLFCRAITLRQTMVHQAQRSA
jgi:hypothetical protein